MLWHLLNLNVIKKYFLKKNVSATFQKDSGDTFCILTASIPWIERILRLLSKLLYPEIFREDHGVFLKNLK